MRSMSMKILGLCFIAAMALSAVALTSASAAGRNPRWAVCNPVPAGTGHFEDNQCTKGGTGNWEARELTKGETKGISVEANGSQELRSAEVTILCNKLSVQAGAQIIGGEPGTDQEILVYEECKVVNFPTCKVQGPPKAGHWGTIETRVLSSSLGYKTKGAEETENQKETVTVFKPQTKEVFVELELEKEAGGSCPGGGTLEKIGLPVKGEVACENVEGATHLVKHELNCPETAIKVYWLQVAGSPKEEKLKKLELLTAGATYVGKSKIGLTDGQDWWIV